MKAQFVKGLFVIVALGLAACGDKGTQNVGPQTQPVPGAACPAGQVFNGSSCVVAQYSPSGYNRLYGAMTAFNTASRSFVENAFKSAGFGFQINFGPCYNNTDYVSITSQVGPQGPLYQVQMAVGGGSHWYNCTPPSIIYGQAVAEALNNVYSRILVNASPAIKFRIVSNDNQPLDGSTITNGQNLNNVEIILIRNGVESHFSNTNLTKYSY